jgi:hypothetical protein
VINDFWYQNAITRCLSLSTFMDAKGEGIAGFRVLMNVTTIWLMPHRPQAKRPALTFLFASRTNHQIWR